MQLYVQQDALLNMLYVRPIMKRNSRSVHGSAVLAQNFVSI